MDKYLSREDRLASMRAVRACNVCGGMFNSPSPGHKTCPSCTNDLEVNEQRARLASLYCTEPA